METKKKYSLYINPTSRTYENTNAAKHNSRGDSKCDRSQLIANCKYNNTRHTRMSTHTNKDLNIIKTSREVLPQGMSSDIRKRLTTQFYNFNKPVQRRNHPLKQSMHAGKTSLRSKLIHEFKKRSGFSYLST